MRVAVIGAGVSGLAAIKCCRDEGLDVVCFEKRSDLGGLWTYSEVVQPGQSNVTRFAIANITDVRPAHKSVSYPVHPPSKFLRL